MLISTSSRHQIINALAEYRSDYFYIVIAAARDITLRGYYKCVETEAEVTSSISYSLQRLLQVCDREGSRSDKAAHYNTSLKWPLQVCDLRGSRSDKAVQNETDHFE